MLARSLIRSANAGWLQSGKIQAARIAACRNHLPLFVIMITSAFTRNL
jgi:hypothetical protein